MIYFKIVDPNSEAWKITEEYNKKIKAEREATAAIPKNTGLPEDLTVMSTNFGPACFKPVEGMDIPEGLRVSKQGVTKGKWVPDRKSTLGKEIQKAMDAIKPVKASDYTKSMFGTTASCMISNKNGAFKMVTSVSFSSWPKQNKAMVSSYPEFWKSLSTKPEFNYPEGLVEITGTQYHALHDELEAKAKAQKEKEEA